jgi:hypothetical protein
MKLDLRGKKPTESADTISQQLRDQPPPVLLSPKRTSSVQLERADTHVGSFPTTGPLTATAPNKQQPTQAKSASNSPFNSNAKERSLNFSSPYNRPVKRDSAKELRISAGLERERKTSVEFVFRSENTEFETGIGSDPEMLKSSASGRRMLSKAASVQSTAPNDAKWNGMMMSSSGQPATTAGSGSGASTEKLFNAEKIRYRRSSEKLLRKNLSRTKTSSDATLSHRESLSNLFSEATSGSDSREGKCEVQAQAVRDRDESFQWRRREAGDSPADSSEALSGTMTSLFSVGFGFGLSYWFGIGFGFGFSFGFGFGFGFSFFF